MPAELDDVQSAVGRENLVLQPDRLSQDIAFHVDRCARKLLLADVLALEGVQPLDQADRETRRRSEAAERGQVRRKIDLNVLEHSAVAQNLTERPVLYIVEATRVLDLPVSKPDLVIEQPRRQVRHRVIDVLVDRSAEHCATVDREKVREVGSAAEEADSERGAGNYHALAWNALVVEVEIFQPIKGRRTAIVASAPLHQNRRKGEILA